MAEQHPAITEVEKLVSENDMLKYFMQDVIKTLDRWAREHIGTEADIKHLLGSLLSANHRHKFFDEPYVTTLKRLEGTDVYADR